MQVRLRDRAILPTRNIGVYTGKCALARRSFYTGTEVANCTHLHRMESKRNGEETTRRVHPSDIGERDEKSDSGGVEVGEGAERERERERKCER